jgi:hypothetical protein
LAGGIALMVFGAGLVLSNPAVRQFLIGRLAGATGSDESLHGVAGVLPDIERYMKIRSM